MLAGLDNKNPSVKAETAAFLGRCFAKCNATILNKKILKAYCPALVKTLNESGNLLLSFFKLLSLIPLFQICSLDPSVRDSSAEALGVAMKVVGEKIIMPFLPDLEAMKMAKIKECCEKAVVSGKPAGATKPKAPVSNETAAPPKAAEVAPKKTGPVIKKPTAAASATSSAPKKAPGKPVAKKAAGAKVEEKIEKELSPEEVEEKAAAILPPDVMTGITDSNWKTRLSSMESLMQVIENKHLKII